MNRAFNEFDRGMESTGLEHINLAGNMCRELIEPLKTYIQFMDKLYQLSHEEISRNRYRIDKMEKKLISAIKKRDDVVKKMERFVMRFENTHEVSGDKNIYKYNKLNKKTHMNEERVEKMTKELRDAKENWNKRWMSLGDSIQIMEEKRVEMIKNITKAYSAMIRQVNGKEMETQCRMEQTFENITEELAITEYMTYSKGEDIAVKSPTPISKKFRQTIESKIKEYRLSRCDYSLKSLKESLANLSRKELEITPHSEQIFMTKRLNSYGIDGDNPGLRKEKTEPPTKKRQTLIFTEGKQVVGYVKAIFDYEAEEEWEISLREGDVIAVYRRNEDGWWEGEIVDGDRDAIRKRGLFPSNFTKPSK